MKMALVLVTFFASCFASALTNPAVKNFPKGFKKARTVATTSSDVSDACVKPAERFARASYEAILGAGKVDQVVWLAVSNAIDAQENQLKDKFVIEVSVQTKEQTAANKKLKEADKGSGYVVDIFMDGKCVPAIARYYDVNTDAWENADTLTWK